MTTESGDPSGSDRADESDAAANTPAFAGPVALVVGASRGLGLLCSARLAERGYNVAIASRSLQRCEVARERLLELGALPDRVHAFECDAGDHRQVEALVEEVERTLGPIEVGLHVAGIIQVGPWQQWERAQFQDAIGTMLWGPINLCLPLAHRMTGRGSGRIGVVSSVGGLVSAPHLLPYSTAKFGAFGFSQGLGAELSGTGVSVTSIAPGLMRIGSHRAAQFKGDHAAEFGWFAAGASAPLLAIDADRAATKIVDGVLAGRPFITFTPLAQVGARMHGVAPGLTRRALGVVARMLPDAPAETTAIRAGCRVEGDLPRRRRRVLDRLTTLGRAAATGNLEPSPESLGD